MLYIVFHMGFLGGVFDTEEKANFFAELIRRVYGESHFLANVSVAPVPVNTPFVRFSSGLQREWDDFMLRNN